MDGRGLVLRELRWAAAYLLVAAVGTLTATTGPTAGLVWSAGAVGVLWLSGAGAATLRWDLGVLGALVLAQHALGPAPLTAAGAYLVAHVVQLGFLAPALRRACRHLHGFGGTEALTGPRDVARIVVLAVVASGLTCLVGALGLLVAGTPVDPLELLTAGVRSAAGLVIVVVGGALLTRRVAELRGRAAWAPYRHSWRSPAEPVALWAGTFAALAAVFGPLSGTPASFVLLSVTVLVASRLGPIGALAHTTFVGGAVIFCTTLGQGPFVPVADVVVRALVTQSYGLLSLLTSLLVSFSQHDRTVVAARLEKLQRATAAQARETSSVLEHLQEGLTVVREDGAVLLTNLAAERLVGTPLPARVDPEGIRAALSLARPDGSPVAIDQVPFVRAARGETFRDDYLMVRPGDTGPVVMEVSGGPIPVEPGEPARGVVTYRDVTALRHDRDALASFAGVVAHDLKRPLSVIVGWTGALADEVRTGEVDREAWSAMLDKVVGAADRMAGLLDDLLSYTVVRDAPVQSVPVDVSAVAEQAAEIFRSREARPVVTVQPGLVALADPALLRQVVDNLVGNATKYVAPGVRPRVHVSGRTADGWILVTVRDNGIGVPPELRERVFEMFQRGHDDEYRGTGLGLAIVQRAVERCGGTVWVRDAGADDAYPDGTTAPGSVFEVRLPGVQDTVVR